MPKRTFKSSKSSRASDALRIALPIAAVLLVITGAYHGLRSCARDEREHAFVARQEPLARSFAKYRTLLARASALQPNFKEFTDEIPPSRCRELQGLIRSRYEVDPFSVDGRCDEGEERLRLDPCEGARSFAQIGGGESQLGRSIGVVLQSRRHLERQEANHLEVVTLLLADDHSLIEVHRFLFEGDSMGTKPSFVVVRAVGDEGLLEREEEGGAMRIAATTPDGVVRLFRRSAPGAAVVEGVRGAGAEGWLRAELLPTLGPWYGTSEGWACQAPAFSELEVERKDERVLCTRVRVCDGRGSKTWDRGSECASEAR
jgi:hypothetical protein